MLIDSYYIYELLMLEFFSCRILQLIMSMLNDSD
jgi:hypothetical protein